MEGKRVFLKVLYKIILRDPGIWDNAAIPRFLPGHEVLWAGICVGGAGGMEPLLREHYSYFNWDNCAPGF